LTKCGNYKANFLNFWANIDRPHEYILENLTLIISENQKENRKLRKPENWGSKRQAKWKSGLLLKL